MDKVCKIDLAQTYLASDLINLLRARTFEPYPACYFEDAAGKYEIRIEIKKRDEKH